MMNECINRGARKIIVSYFIFYHYHIALFLLPIVIHIQCDKIISVANEIIKMKRILTSRASKCQINTLIMLNKFILSQPDFSSFWRPLFCYCCCLCTLERVLRFLAVICRLFRHIEHWTWANKIIIIIKMSANMIRYQKAKGYSNALHSWSLDFYGYRAELWQIVFFFKLQVWLSAY